MALIGFEPDMHPNAPPGAGYALADSGERAYVVDPNLAAQFSGQAPAPPQQAPQDTSYDLMSAADLQGSDQRLALGGQGGGRQGYNAPPPSVADVGPNMSVQPEPTASAAPPPAPTSSQAEPMSSPANAPPQTSPAQPQRPIPEVDQDEQLRAQLQTAVNAPVYEHGVKGGLRQKSAEVTSEGAEAPLSQADWRELQDDNEAIAQTRVAKAGVMRAQADQQIAQAQAQMPALQQQYEENKSKYDQARSAATQDLAKVNGLLQEVNSKKIDHKRLFLQSGFVGNMFAGIAQALGASSAVLGHTGHNMVKEQIDTALSNDIAEQREEIENGRASANNALQMLRDRYNFDIPQAESALKISQLGVQNAQLKQFEGMKMSQDAQMGIESWMAENKKAMFMEARKLYTASVGKQTRKEQFAYQQGSPGGLRQKTHKEKMDTYAEIEAGQKVGAIDKPGGGEKVDPNTVVYKSDGTAVAARNPGAADKIREKFELYKKTMPAIAGLEKSSGHWNTLSPDERAAFNLNFETAASTFNTGLGQGVMRSDDMERWRGYLGQGNFGVKRALAELKTLAQNSYDAAVDSQSGPQVTEDFSHGKPRASYTKSRAATPTEARTSQKKAGADRLQAELAKFANGGAE